MDTTAPASREHIVRWYPPSYRAASLVLGCALAGLSSGCLTHVVPDPALRIPEAEFRARIKTVCLEDLRTIPPLPDETKSHVAQFEALLAEELKHASVTVVPADKTTAVLKSVKQRAGGYFDPDTGLRNQAKYQTVLEHGWRELRSQLGCDALLVPTLAVVTAPWANGVALWDGVSEPVSGASTAATGYVSALSLWISIRDGRDHELYFGTGGIQILSKFYEGFFDRHFERVAVETLLTDPRRNLRAIHASLEPFLGPYAGGSVDELSKVQTQELRKRHADAAERQRLKREP